MSNVSASLASLKIRADLHQRIKIQTAKSGVKIQDFAEKALEKLLASTKKSKP
jgi:hypothetical protein